MKVENWISYADAGRYEKSIGGWGGWFNAETKGMRWPDFIGRIVPEERPYYEAVRQSVLASGLRLKGRDHQHGEAGVPLFEDGTVGLFTYRAWGDLMAAVWSENDDTDYSYLDFDA